MAKVLESKTDWTKDELLSALSSIGENDFARDVVEKAFKHMATKNTTGELVIKCGKPATAKTVLMNLQAKQLELAIRVFLSMKGYDLDEFWRDHNDEFHMLLTSMFKGLYQGRSESN